MVVAAKYDDRALAVDSVSFDAQSLVHPLALSDASDFADVDRRPWIVWSWCADVADAGSLSRYLTSH